MSRLVDRPRWHTDHLVVSQRRRTAAQPLPQAGLHECPGLPRRRFEHGRGQIEIRDRNTHSVESISAPAPHAFTVIRGGKPASHGEWVMRLRTGSPSSLWWWRACFLWWRSLW
jgi:hypothetical protein